MIEIKHLTKRYGNHIAVNDLTLSIENGQIYGFLGPNGAGKSTTMNIMTGCLAASEGTVLIDGFDVFDDAQEARKRIGYLPEIPPLYPDRTPREYLSFVAEAKGLRGSAVKEQVQSVMEKTDIADVADRLCKNLSKGYKQRVGIAQALLGDPEIIILDEPTVGLDPTQIIQIRDLIKELGKDHTVILSSHILSEVQAVCQTIMIISKGNLIACDTPDNLEKLFTDHVSVTLTADTDASTAAALARSVDDIEASETISDSAGRCTIKLTASRVEADDVCRKLFFAFADNKTAILELSVEKANLEEIFLELISNDDAGTHPSAQEDSSENIKEEVKDEVSL